jgi:hypothetical protein
MKNTITLKRGFLAVFSLTLIVFTFFGCEEDLTIEVPYETSKEFTLDIPTGQFADTQFFDVSSPEFNKYKDRIDKMTADSLKFELIDHTPGGSAIVNSGNFKFLFSTRNIDFPFADGFLKQRLEIVKLGHIEGLKEVFESFVIDDAAKNDPTIEMIMSGDAQGPVNYTVKMTIWGLIEAKTE